MMKSSAVSPHSCGKQDAMMLLWHTTNMSALKTTRRIKCGSAGTNQYCNAEAPLCMFDPNNNQFSVTARGNIHSCSGNLLISHRLCNVRRSALITIMFQLLFSSLKLRLQRKRSCLKLWAKRTTMSSFFYILKNKGSSFG